MAIRFVPKVGQILLCDFGQFPSEAHSHRGPSDLNGRIPPEMVKRRLVVVLNARLDRRSCIVVPLSTSHDASKMKVGVNVELPAHAFCAIAHFEPCVRWAKADCVHTVSNRRLTSPMDSAGPVQWVVDLAWVRRIQRAAVRALNAGSMLRPCDEEQLLIEARNRLEEAS